MIRKYHIAVKVNWLNRYNTVDDFYVEPGHSKINNKNSAHQYYCLNVFVFFFLLVCVEIYMDIITFIPFRSKRLLFFLSCHFWLLGIKIVDLRRHKSTNILYLDFFIQQNVKALGIIVFLVHVGLDMDVKSQ